MTDSSAQDDLWLVHLAQGGDYAAFAELVGRYQHRLYSLAFKVLHQHQDAENVVQETFLAALEHLHEFRAEAKFSTWLLRIAANAAFKVLRKRRGLPTVPLTDAPDDYRSLPHPDFIADWRDNPEQLAQQAETQRLLREAMRTLDEKYRLVFYLRDVEELSTADTAAALGLTEGTVKVRLLRARLMLREYLTRHFGDPEKRLYPNHAHEE
ncbi:MAG: sigma-70 family RNA polymerase sigma factor [Gemmataceae bacterium]